jgi:hypothetical protein
MAEEDPQWTSGEQRCFCLSCGRGGVAANGRAVAESEKKCCGVFVLIGWLTWHCFGFAAWQQNQPKPVFANVSDNEEEGQEE